MFWLRPIVSDDMKAWITDCFDWFDARFPPPETAILPTKAYFTAGRGTDAATARLILEEIAAHMGVCDPVDLMPLNMLPAEYRLDYTATSSVAGTYVNDGGVAVISYDPELMNRPLQFINTLSHELMHARLDGLVDDVPGGAGAHELATDLGCIIAGFGVFQMQAADDAGWTGYMSQPSRAYALAGFLHRRGQGMSEVRPFLSSRCQRLLRRALKEVAKDG